MAQVDLGGRLGLLLPAAALRCGAVTWLVSLRRLRGRCLRLWLLLQRGLAVDDCVLAQAAVADVVVLAAVPGAGALPPNR